MKDSKLRDFLRDALGASVVLTWFVGTPFLLAWFSGILHIKVCLLGCIGGFAVACSPLIIAALIDLARWP